MGKIDVKPNTLLRLPQFTLAIRHNVLSTFPTPVRSSVINLVNMKLISPLKFIKKNFISPNYVMLNKKLSSR